MIFRRLDAGVVLFLGMIMAGSAAAAGSPAPSHQTFGTSIQSATEAVPSTLGQYLDQLAPEVPRKVENDCDHITHANFCACNPNACP